MAFITSSCSIVNGIICKDDQVIYKDMQASVADFLLNACRNNGINYARYYKMDPLSKLGWLAAELMLASQPQMATYDPYEVGLVLFNRNASLDADLKYFSSVKEIASPALFVYTLPNIVIGEICIRHGFKGESVFLISEAFDAERLQEHVQLLFQSNTLRCCIAGWVEILDDQYKIVLYLIERDTTFRRIPLSTVNIHQIYNNNNG